MSYEKRQQPTSYEEHSRLSKDVPVRAAVVTISDTRTEATDRSGRYLVDALEEAGVEVIGTRIVPDEPDEIASILDVLIPQCEVVITTGGTGISRRDTTIEVVTRKIDRHLPGFGELFRMLSYEEIGAGAMLSRAVAGLIGDVLIFCLPGSIHAVRLAAERLILPELEHLVWEIVRQHA